MFKWRLFKKNPAVVGIELLADGMAVVAQHWEDGMPKVSCMDFLRYADGSTPENLLKHWVTHNQLTHAQCYVVMGAEHYQILLVEPPDVPAADLRNAIRWRLKDLISIPLNQATIDVFSLPEDGVRSNKKMVYVVAAQEANVRQAIETVARAGLELVAIDIGELAMRNIANRLICDGSSDRGVAVARIRRGGGSVYIFKNGNMYLARSFNLDYKGGLLDSLPEESLALELQRSVDYYERQMGQAPPTVIYICGENIIEDKLGSALTSKLAVRVQMLDPAAVVILDGDVDAGLSQRCVGALGGSMRQEQVA
jgi:MSHA biogenesis protein MshI